MARTKATARKSTGAKKSSPKKAKSAGKRSPKKSPAKKRSPRTGRGGAKISDKRNLGKPIYRVSKERLAELALGAKKVLAFEQDLLKHVSISAPSHKFLNALDIPNASLVHLLKSAGAIQYSKTALPEVHELLAKNLYLLAHKVLLITQNAKRKTVLEDVVKHAAKDFGVTHYGTGKDEKMADGKPTGINRTVMKRITKEVFNHIAKNEFNFGSTTSKSGKINHIRIAERAYDVIKAVVEMMTRKTLTAAVQLTVYSGGVRVLSTSIMAAANLSCQGDGRPQAPANRYKGKRGGGKAKSA